MTPAQIPLFADRDVLFGQSFGFWKKDFTGASYLMKIRLTPDAGGSALITLTTTASSTAEGVRTIYAGTDTIANHIAAGRTTEAKAAAAGYALTDSILLSVVGVRILKTTMGGAAIPYPEAIGQGQRGDNVVLAHDLLVTPSGADEYKAVYGPFTVRGTVAY
jgi:hypothetical protein